MRLIDANALHKEISEWPESVMYKDWVQAAIANAQTITPPTNDPLTLEELREMDGEPVWVVPLNDFDILPANYLVNAYAEQIVVDKFGAYLDFEDYGKTWLAYRRRPEEG